MWMNLLEQEVAEHEADALLETCEWWFEGPGAHHLVSATASKSRPARLLAVFVVDAAENELTTPDPEFRVHGYGHRQARVSDHAGMRRIPAWNSSSGC
jgi:hypothetical protein